MLVVWRTRKLWKWELGNRRKTRERCQLRKAWLCPVFNNCPDSILGFIYMHHKTGDFFFCVLEPSFVFFSPLAAITYLILKENEKEREMDEYEK